MAWIYCLMYCNDIPQKTLKFFFNIFTVSHIIYLIFTTKVLLNWEIWTLCIIFHDLNLRVLLEVQVLLFNRLHSIGNLFLDPELHYQFMNLTSWKKIMTFLFLELIDHPQSTRRFHYGQAWANPCISGVNENLIMTDVEVKLKEI